MFHEVLVKQYGLWSNKANLLKTLSLVSYTGDIPSSFGESRTIRILFSAPFGEITKLRGFDPKS